MKRREFLASSALVAGTSLLASQNSKASHHMETNKGKVTIPSTLNKKLQKEIIAVTQECIDYARECLAHCARDLASGSLMMAECNLSVQSMLPLCEGMNRVVHLNSMKKDTLSALAQACTKACEDCYQACKPHIKMHDECKNCAESCLKCIEVCKKIA